MYYELGRTPLIIKRKLRAIKYWMSLKTTNNCILKSCLDDMIIRNDDWVIKIKNELESLGVGYLFNSTCDKYDLCIIEQRLKDSYQQLLLSDICRSSKGIIYQHLVDHFNLQPYLKKHVRKDFLQQIAKFRLSSHKLQVEIGRHSNIQRNNRICQHCNLNDVEDEYHFILVCPAYNYLRCSYIKRYYRNRPSVYKLIQLLSTENVKELGNLGRFLSKACKQREDNR